MAMGSSHKSLVASFLGSVKWVLALLALAGCASSQMRARKAEREQLIQTTKLYCDFVNGEMYPDIEVVLNIEMSKHCDFEKAMTITNYKTPSENVGIMYCCSLLIPKSIPVVRSETGGGTGENGASSAGTSAPSSAAHPASSGKSEGGGSESP